mmetsp:Transcript_12408/g.26920  ORF Transcript_12408/g.26920 Transcript_12408/m.26920 type:complete len:222 (+) Transcript_12408:1377-2042(+)
MLKLLENEDDADVALKIGDTLVPAHKLILKTNAPILFGFCKKHDKESPVHIEGTSREVFLHVLRYVYGGEVPSPSEMMLSGKALIDASDRFGIIGLKLAVENALVEGRVIDLHNFTAWMVFADARTCPLLKEYAVSYFIGRAKDVLAHESSKNLKDSPRLMEELMTAMFIDSDTLDHEDGASKMSVNELRVKLGEMGFDVDGSKAMLVSRLETSNEEHDAE